MHHSCALSKTWHCCLFHAGIMTGFLSVDIDRPRGSAPVQDPEAAAKEAAASLPPEPAASDASGCNIAVRFPDGKRQQRRFPREAPVSAVAAFCRTIVEVAAAGRPFFLTETFPGENLPLLHPAAFTGQSVTLRIHAFTASGNSARFPGWRSSWQWLPSASLAMRRLLLGAFCANRGHS